jgi:uncharacterized protein YyaL (SSP411 family)
MANRLAQESSPYLQQHAENPVDWFPWGDEAFAKAKAEDKMLLVSIGYSSCHWCHVMEHESFSNDEVAEVMNRYFVCIKVDREERTDLDQIYMNAVQLMSGQGGWPLNCFILPDGRPVYGGTYFPPDAWMRVMHHLNAIWKDEREKVLDYAEKLTEGVRLSDLLPKVKHDGAFAISDLNKMLSRWKNRFDNIEGGPNRAPKFPLPNNYLFLQRYGVMQNDRELLDHGDLTLRKMAMGGIYDQIGGGITRYSTDMIWKVPHFEKMLYDNAQILSLYSEAWRRKKDPLYKELVESCFGFLEREFRSPHGAYYSALDADSEGEEGKYYVWTIDELREVCGEDFEWVKLYFSVNQLGHWEHGIYILMRRMTDEEFVRMYKWDAEEFAKKKKYIIQKIHSRQLQRVYPFLDDKLICSWNAMLMRGLADAWKAFGEEVYRERALALGHFILREMLKGDGGLFHCMHRGKAYGDAFLEDYSFVMEGMLALYEISGDETWLKWTGKFAHYVDAHFSSSDSDLFYYTSSKGETLIARKTEFSDNVIPASNSSLANAFCSYALYSGEEKFRSKAEQMLAAVMPQMADYGAGFSNWALLLLSLVEPQREIVVTGPDAEMLVKELYSLGVPLGVPLVFSTRELDLPLLKNRLKTDRTLIYICLNKSCNLPTSSPEEALRSMV